MATQAIELKEWNHRYVCYAKANGKSPDEMLAFDKERHPSACMCEYTIWNSAKWSEWRKLNGIQPHAPLSAKQHKQYDAWLEQAVSP